MTGRNKRSRKRTSSNSQSKPAALAPSPPVTDTLLKSLSSITIQPYDGTVSPTSTLSPTFSSHDCSGTPATSPSSSPPVLLTAVEVAEKNIDGSLYLLDASVVSDAPELNRGMTCFLSRTPPQTLVAGTVYPHDPRAPFPEPLKQGFIAWATGQPRPRNPAENTYNNRTMRFWRMATDFDRFQSGDDDDGKKARKPTDPPSVPETWWTSPQRPYTAPPHQMYNPPPPPPSIQQERKKVVSAEKVSPYASRHRY